MEDLESPQKPAEDETKISDDGELMMSEAGQRRVLKLYWAKLAQDFGHKPLAEDAIDAFTTRLLEVTSHATSDRMIVFKGIQMKMQMVAEIVEDYVIETTDTPPPETLDLLQLLDRFVDKKFNTYVHDKFNIKPSDVHYEFHVGFHRKEFVESHMEAALVEILGDRDFKKLQPKSTGKNYKDFFGEYKSDFAHQVFDNTQFTHAVFAAYFAARWFAEHFAENAAFLAASLYTTRFIVVRHLFDRIVARDCDLHGAVLDDDLVAVRDLLRGYGIDADRKDRAGRTALHLAAALRSHSLSYLLDTLIEHTTDVDAKDDILGGTPLLYADTARTWTAIDKLLGCKADERFLPATSAKVDDGVMLSAVFEQDLDNLMAFCLDHGLPVEGTARRRLLSRASEEGSLRIATLLIGRGADIDAVDGEATTPLSLASSNGHLDMVRLLVLSAKVRFYRNINKMTALPETDEEVPDFQDALTGLEKCICSKTSFVKATFRGTTALHDAADNGCADVAAYLIREGGDPWSRNDTGATPLHKASQFGPGVVPILLAAVDAEQRASYVDATDKAGNTALHKACVVGTLKAVHLLRKAGGSLTVRNLKGQTPLIVATENGELKVIQYLLSTFDADGERLAEERSDFAKKDHINDKDVNGMSALHTAARHGHVGVTSYLLAQGAFVRSRDSMGRTPLHYAAGQKKDKSLGVLLSAVAKEERAGFVNEEDDDGNTALHRAALWGQVHSLEYLVKAGGSLRQLNKRLQTPVMVAAEEDHQEVVTLLECLDG